MTCSVCSPAETILVINGTESRLQVALGSGSGLLWSQELQTPGRAMPYLAPAVRQGLATCELDLAALRGIACVRGPGGFTGLRLALATTLGLARGSGLPLAGIDYLPAIAASVAPLLASELWVATHARQRMVYLQGFTPVLGEPLCAPFPAPLDTALGYLQRRETALTLVGSGLRRFPEQWTEALPDAVFLPAAWNHPHPQTLLRLAEEAEFTQTPPSPLYLRASDAEDNLSTIAGKRGLDPDAARQSILDFLS